MSTHTEFTVAPTVSHSVHKESWTPESNSSMQHNDLVSGNTSHVGCILSASSEYASQSVAHLRQTSRLCECCLAANDKVPHDLEGDNKEQHKTEDRAHHHERQERRESLVVSGRVRMEAGQALTHCFSAASESTRTRVGCNAFGPAPGRGSLSANRCRPRPKKQMTTGYCCCFDECFCRKDFAEP